MALLPPIVLSSLLHDAVGRVLGVGEDWSASLNQIGARYLWWQPLGLGLAAGLLLAWGLGRGRRRRQAAPETRPFSLEEVPAQAMILDLSALGRAMSQLRADGITDLHDHLQKHPLLPAQWFRLIRLVAANHQAISAADCANLEELRNDLPQATERAPYNEALLRLLDAIWDHRWVAEGEYTFTNAHGNLRTCLVRFALPQRVGQLDLTRVQLLIVDLTLTKHTLANQLDSQERLRDILVNANILLWWAKVHREAGQLRWNFDIPIPATKSEIYRLATALDIGGLWDNSRMPDADRMLHEANQALDSGAPGYQHEFRVLGPDRVHWLHEEVSIQKLGSDEWSLVGLVTDDTARHEIADAQVQSATQLRQILSRPDCMIWQATVTDVGTKLDWFFDVPPSGLELRVFGVPDGLKTKTIYAGLQLPQLPQMNACGSQAIRSGATGYEQEFPVVRPDGQTFWLHERISIHRLSSTQWQLVGFTIDVTARHEAEAARLATESQLQQLLERADCLLWLGRVSRAPSGQQDWRLYIPPSLLFRRLFNADPAPDRTYLWDPAKDEVLEYPEMLQRCLQAVEQNQSSYAQDFRLRRGAQTFWLHEHVSLTATGPNEWRLVGVIVDTTARREAEMAVAAEKERLAVTLRAMTEAVITLDAGGIVQFLNRAAAELLQQEPARLIGQPLAKICQLAHGSGESLALPLSQALAAGQPYDLPADAHLVVAQALPPRLVEGCCMPVRDPRSVLTGAVLVLRDVTERHRLEEHIQRASKLESVGLLAGGIAHDFNNILTAILGNLTMVREDVQGQPELEECLDDAQQATARARDLTQQLLTFAKGGDPVRAALNLSQVLTEVTQFSLRGSPIRCDFALAPDLWPALADKGQIAQVVQNLVINAVQAMPTGGQLRLEARNETIGRQQPHPSLALGEYLRLTIADTGTGIAPDNLPRIFDPYFTTKRQGHGLGLATVYSIVKKHQGHIEVHSTVGQGTTFTIWLPAAHEAPAALAAAPVPAAPATRLVGRALFMDDEDSIVFLGTKMLQRLGLEVEVARDGREALEKYRAARAAGRPFALVIMDLTVPGGMGGKEAIGLLQKLDPAVKAIVSSGYSSDPVLADFRKYGFCGMVAKPYEIAEFTRTVRRVLEGKP